MLPALVIYQDFRSGDLISFLKHTFDQSVYPFLNSWFLGLYYCIFGVSIISSRVYSLICYFFFLIVLYFLGRKICKRPSAISGLIPCFFALTSSIVLIYAAKSTLELPYLFVAYCTFALYLNTINKPSRNKLIAVSCLMAAGFLIEYGYGILMVITLLATHLINNGFKVKSIINKSVAYLFGPFIVLSIIWLSFPFRFVGYVSKIPFTASSYLKIKLPYKLAGLLYLPTSDVSHYKMFSWENAVYYFKIISNQFSISLIVALLLLVFFSVSFRDIKNKRTNVFLIYFVVTMILAFLYPIKSHRYIISAVPCLWLLAGYQINNLILKAKKMSLAYRYFLNLFVVLFVFLHVPSVVNLYKNYPQRLSWEYESKKDHLEVYNFILSHIDVNKKVVEVGFRDPLLIQGLTWHILARPSNKDISYDDLKLRSVPLWNLADDRLYDAKHLVASLREYLDEKEVDYIVFTEWLGDSTEHGDLRYQKVLAVCRELLNNQDCYKIVRKKLFKDIQTEVAIYKANSFY
ncbi:MAG: glycosyltransferase family 39 protein [Candidatus Omnitrophica bacterium]|nr:glycosyltransferase family 39 protein [Candidatus Omnitrophota bacterium]